MKKVFLLAGTLALSGAFALTAFAASPEAEDIKNVWAERVAAITSADSPRVSFWADHLCEDFDIEALVNARLEMARNFDRENFFGHIEGSERINEEVLLQMRQRIAEQFSDHDINKEELVTLLEQFRQGFGGEGIRIHVGEFRQNGEFSFDEALERIGRRHGDLVQISCDELMAIFEQHVNRDVQQISCDEFMAIIEQRVGRNFEDVVERFRQHLA